jgi:lipopolysaccharide transport system permease protein
MNGSNQLRRTKVIRPATFSPLTIVRGARDLIHYRDLLLTLTIHRINVRYKQSALGIAWAVLQPLLLMIVYTIIFSVVVKMPHEGGPYAVFVYAALLPWTFFSTAVTTSASSLVAHNNLITKVYFPREILPLTYVLAAFFDFLIASVILMALLGSYHVSLTVGALLVCPIMLVAVLFSLAMALLLSAFQVRFRDIGIAMGLLLQLWMYATPVVYPYSIVPDRFVFWYSLNPMAGVVENFRRVILQHGTMNMAVLLPGVIVCMLLLPLAYLYFKTSEATMADVI